MAQKERCDAVACDHVGRRPRTEHPSSSAARPAVLAIVDRIEHHVRAARTGIGCLDHGLMLQQPRVRIAGILLHPEFRDVGRGVLVMRAANAAGPVQSIPTSAPPHPGAQAEEAASEDQDLHKITSPIVGTFYRAPSPTADSFVRIGSQVEPTTVVCIIEAMKLMNEIQAETTGEVVKIYVENGQAVEYGQPLFGIKTP